MAPRQSQSLTVEESVGYMESRETKVRLGMDLFWSEEGLDGGDETL